MIKKEPVTAGVRLFARRKQLWLEISVPPLVRNVIAFANTFFEQLESGIVTLKKYRWLVSMTAGVGLGLGFSLVAFQQPSYLQATPVVQTVSDAQGIEIERLEVGDSMYAVESGVPEIAAVRPWMRLVHDQRFGSLSDHQAVVVADLRVGGTGLSDLGLGATIKAVGSNNGTYTFVVTEIRRVPLNQLAGLVADFPNSLVLYSWGELLHAESTVIIAQVQR